MKLKTDLIAASLAEELSSPSPADEHEGDACMRSLSGEHLPTGSL